MERVDTLVVGSEQLVTAEGREPLRGTDMRKLKIIKRGGVAIRGEYIVSVGVEDELKSKYTAEKIIDAEGGCITPGLVDAHTHLVFAGSREDEFIMRIRGKTYKEIALAGGGINATVKATREASEDALVELGWARLNNAVSYGTTTVGILSGYGLDTENELKLLRAILTLKEEHSLHIVPIFLGAHDIPPEYKENKEKYVRLVVEEMIPKVVEGKLSKFCDVFCEAHTFNIEESKKILTTAKNAGLFLSIHADELEPMGAAELAVELGAISASHLLKVSDKGISALAKSNTIAMLLPGVSFFLKMDYAPARKLIDSGAAVALSTDCNPGSSYTESMQIIMTLASLYLQMLPEEVLVASTLNGAAALNLADRVGTLEPGKFADIAIWRENDFKKLPYHWGVNLIKTVLKAGEVLVQR
ncbi:MAG: imidazolonepropionase [Planctomycetota bacterium]|nr:imidazolonepropionase [Planctomycetota bacterium]